MSVYKTVEETAAIRNRAVDCKANNCLLCAFSFSLKIANFIITFLTLYYSNLLFLYTHSIKKMKTKHTFYLQH